MDKLNEIELRMSAVGSNEAFARRLVGDFVLELNPTVEELEDIKTVISEAVTNAIVHGYDSDSSGIITIKCSLYPCQVTMCVEDNGVGIADIEKAVEPFYTTKPNDDRSGMGFTLMKSFMDEFGIESTPNKGTRVIMTKYLSEVEDDARTLSDTRAN